MTPMDNDTIRKLLDEATPGPWSLYETRRRMITHVSAGTWTDFASVCTRLVGDDEPDAEGVANARLIAAAPYLAAEVLRLRERLLAKDDETIRLAAIAGEEISKLKDALAFYADAHNYDTRFETRECGCCTDDFVPVTRDAGETARAALGDTHDA